MTHDFRLTGKHVLAMLLGFFLLIVTANLVFVSYAVRTFPGEQEKKSYLQGLNYNDRLAARAEQASLGWTATIVDVSFTGDQVDLQVVIADKTGAPISGLDIAGAIARPASDVDDRAIAFAETDIGAYRGRAPVSAGVWVLAGRAVNRRGDEFEFSNRLMLQ